MSLKPGQLSRIVQSSIGDINKKFRAELGRIDLPKLIIDLIQKGISPVAGAVGRFKRYSQSYIDQITNKAAFFNKNGKVISVRVDQEGISKKQKKTNKDFIKEVNKSRGFDGKRRSPVNMTLSGDMVGSLDYKVNSGKLIASDFKWSLHNNGEGNLPERRLLPDREGEEFNRRVQQKITESLIKAIGIKGSKRFLSVKFNIKG
jgi:uncharacterized C2H2 Zn-finger protein